MSLREEIMYKIADYKLGKILIAEEAANDIIKLFEKRIDEIKEGLNPAEDKMMISTLNWLKEMLLKQ